MDKKELAAKAVELLKKEYPDAICSLEYEKPHELLFATRLGRLKNLVIGKNAIKKKQICLVFN